MHTIDGGRSLPAPSLQFESPTERVTESPKGSPESHGFFRLGHMGHVNGQMIMGMLGGIEAGMSALGIKRGSGALEAAAKVIGGA